MTQIRAIVVYAGVLALSSPAFAADKGVFVSPTTGVPVSSVWGVFVGVSQYQHKELNLSYAAKDAQALHGFFKGVFAGRVPEDHFALVLDDKAARGNILKALAEVFNRAFEQDLIIVSLSTHGLPDTKGSDLFFLAHDTDPNMPMDRGISRDDIMKLMGKGRARKVVMLIDACNSGGFGTAGPVLAMKNVSAADVNRLLVAMGQAQDGTAVITSSSAAERSQEGQKFCGGHGAFTCAMLGGLQGAADTNNNGLVELRELYDFTYRAVKDSTGGLQNPLISGNFDNGLPLAFVTRQAPLARVEPATPSPASTGCAKDTDCKGDRVCEKGVCVRPMGEKKAASAAAGVGAAVAPDQKSGAESARPSDRAHEWRGKTTIEEKPAARIEVTTPGSAHNSWGHVTFWSGLGLAAFGGVSTVMVVSTADDARSGVAGAGDLNAVWSSLAVGGYAVGGAAMVTGVVLWALAPNDWPAAASGSAWIAPVATDGGAALVWAGRW
ncbi:MAG: caspase family protein [Verrucomicrobia bacterium]|nr:caspase family protein [Verrucomicrobiota bacterium]